MKESLNDEFVRDVLKSGVDLRAYSSQVESELKEVESDLVADYIKQSPNISQLHGQINECDGILERLEGILCTFQADLGNICQEILTLQEESVSLSIRLKNKQFIRQELSSFIEEIIIPEDVITHIIDTPASEKPFLDQLRVLDQKVLFVDEQNFRDAVSCKEVKEILKTLQEKAVAKIREYCLKKVQSFRKPMTNYQITQNALLKNKFFYQFLKNRDRNVARELTAEYLDTMSKVYFSYFKEYAHRLSKLRYEELPDKDDLMAVEENLKSKNSLFNSKPTLKNRSTIFTLGDRGNVINADIESPLIVPHVANKTDAKYAMEVLFRSHQFAVLDNACHEYQFLSEYFILNSKDTQEHFSIVFGKTLTLFTKILEEEFNSSFDSIGLFLCLQIIYRFKILAHKRAVSALDQYWDGLVRIIWPRFEFLFDCHIQSIRGCDVSKITLADTRPHYITRRYAEFSAAILAVNDSFPDERVSVLLVILQNEVENLILKMASKFDSPKEQLIFIINNYDMILGVLLERTKEESSESENIKQQLNRRVQDFVEELLYPHFGPLISFVKECESLIEKNDLAALDRQDTKVASLIKSFNLKWRNAIEDINRDVMTCFTNFKCGNNIQQTALTQIIQYYHRFHKIVSQNPFKNNPSRSELINVHQLMVEVKKYKSNF